MEGDKLDRLQKATEGMTVGDWREFDSFFIGVLSVETSDEVWDSCLKMAVEFFARAKAMEASHETSPA